MSKEKIRNVSIQKKEGVVFLTTEKGEKENEVFFELKDAKRVKDKKLWGERGRIALWTAVGVSSFLYGINEITYYNYTEGVAFLIIGAFCLQNAARSLGNESWLRKQAREINKEMK